MYTTKIFRDVEKAQALADTNARLEAEGWTYSAVDCGNGLAYVEVRDEDGEFVGYL